MYDHHFTIIISPSFYASHPEDRAAVLPVSPLAGQLINRAPFFWSGGLGVTAGWFMENPNIKIQKNGYL